MNSDFRQRFVIPLILPLGVLAVIALFAISLSRVLLAVPETVSVFVALGVATYVLIVGFVIDKRPRITSRALAVGTTLGLAGIALAGISGATAGIRSLEEVEREAAEPAGEGDEGSAQTVTEVPPGAPLWAAGNDLVYTEAPDTMPAGDVQIALELNGGLQHNVVFEGVNNEEPITEGSGEGIYVGDVQIEPGTYIYYCSIAGHRAGGMEGEITVE